MYFKSIHKAIKLKNIKKEVNDLGKLKMLNLTLIN